MCMCMCPVSDRMEIIKDDLELSAAARPGDIAAEDAQAALMKARPRGSDRSAYVKKQQQHAAAK
jgi:hypothetical protein